MTKQPFSYPVLEHPAPQLTNKQAELFSSAWFSEPTFIKPLASERDQNFLFKDQNEKKFVLKVANSKEPFGVLDLQNKALEHLALSTNLILPKVIPDSSSKLIRQEEVNESKHYIRMVSYIDGIPMGDAKQPKDFKVLYFNMGSFLGLLGQGLKGFTHDNSNHRLLWDVKETENLFEIIEFIKDKKKKDLVKKSLEYFVEHIKEPLKKLRSQVIHNDMNPDNVLVTQDFSDSVSGMIDFGDMVFAPLVNDLAVAASYQTVTQQDLLTGICYLLEGYQKEYPLTKNEIALLPGLVVNRIAMGLIIAEWRATTHPENKEYILGSIEKTWDVLRQTHQKQPKEIANQLIRFLSESENKL